MVDYLRGTTDEVTKTDVVKRIGELAERFAPDTQWFLDTMNQVSSQTVFMSKGYDQGRGPNDMLVLDTTTHPARICIDFFAPHCQCYVLGHVTASIDTQTA